MGFHQFLLVILVFLLWICSSASSNCNPEQRDALLRIQSPIQSYWTSLKDYMEDCCSWIPVECDQSGNVIGLHLEEKISENTLLPNSSIFELRFLQSLRLGSDYPNFINFSIPNEIDKLTELRSLHVHRCQGPIPSSIGNLTKLQYLNLYLSGDGTIGSIPDSIGNLRQLTHLQVNGDGISTRIPDSFRNLTNLQTFVSGAMTGNFPSVLLDLPNLESLYVSYGRLQGPLPRSIRPDSKLKFFHFEGNNFTGSLPAWIFTGGFRSVILRNNRISGQILPFRMPNVSYLETLDLRDNRIEGIPKSLFNLKNLSSLSLDGNNLSGALDFALLRGMGRLRELYLSRNKGLTLKSTKVSIDIPQLSTIRMEECGLTAFPNFLSSMSSLSWLFLSKNKMKGRIDFGGGWKSIIELDASNNNIGGPLKEAPPPPSLAYLYLSHNLITGKIPASYCLLRGYLLMDVSFNNITDCAQSSEQCGYHIIC